MVINSNISAQSSARLLSTSSAQLSKSLARLSSGSKITSPEDDVAGLAVSTKFDAQINRITAASTNVDNAISFSQTQDGYLKKVSDALNRMSELAVMSQDVTKATSDKDLYQKEFSSLATYISDMASKTFNGVTLFGGSSGATLKVTVDSDGNAFTLTAVDFQKTLSSSTGYANLSTANVSSNAAGALSTVKTAIDQLASDRAQVGANVASLKMYSDQLGVLKDNLTAANSNIKDVDVAEESTRYARYNILVQAGTAMLAQANATPQSALRLLS
jgi:flagellin